MAQKVNLLEIELAHRIDTDAWIQSGAPNTNAWYITHAEGEPSKVEEVSSVGIYTEKGSIALCHGTAKTWYWDSANNRLYIHTSGSNDPANYIVLSYFWEYHTDKQFSGNEEIVFNDHFYFPDIGGSIPDITQKVTSFLLGSYSMDFGGLTITNADGKYDSRLTNYIYEAKKAIFKQGDLGDVYGSYVDFWRGWTGKVALNDNQLEINTEDLRASVE